jgi:hypothetical protein
MRSNNQNEPNNAGGLQISQCQDLAQALKGKNGLFVATTPAGETLILEAAEGHSIAKLCVLPRGSGQSFNVAQVEIENPSAQQQQR